MWCPVVKLTPLDGLTVSGEAYRSLTRAQKECERIRKSGDRQTYELPRRIEKPLRMHWLICGST